MTAQVSVMEDQEEDEPELSLPEGVQAKTSTKRRADGTPVASTSSSELSLNPDEVSTQFPGSQSQTANEANGNITTNNVVNDTVSTSGAVAAAPPQRIEPLLEPINGIVQPPVVPPPNRPGRNTNQLQFIRNNVIEDVYGYSFAWPFHSPVNSLQLNIQDYYEVVQQPMDLGTIKKRLANNYYWCAQECIDDFSLMFNNCYLYNKTGDDICIMAKSVEKLFLSKFCRMPEEEVELELPLLDDDNGEESADRAVSDAFAASAQPEIAENGTEQSVTTHNIVNRSVLTARVAPPPSVTSNDVINDGASTSSVGAASSRVVSSSSVATSNVVTNGASISGVEATRASQPPVVPPPRIEPFLEPVNGVVQPPVYPPLNRPGRNTNQLQYIRNNIFRAIKRHHTAWPFKEPVDAERLSLPDYHKVITRPMDLGTIERRLQNNYYWCARECIDDFSIMFINCALYNKQGEQIVMMGEHLEATFRSLLATMPKEEVELEPSTEVVDHVSSSSSPDGVLYLLPESPFGSPEPWLQSP